jgi:hypothetical protein
MEDTGRSDEVNQSEQEPSFMQQVLDALAAEKGSREVRGTVDDVERALQKLYERLGVQQEMEGEMNRSITKD